MLLIITGCTKNKEEDKEIKKETISCSYENMNKGVQFITKIDAKIENDKVKSAKATMTYQDAKFAKSMCDTLKKADDASDDLKCEDKVITIDNYHKSLSEKEMTKKEFLDIMDSQQFICEQ